MIPEKDRIIFLDLLRAIAVFLMLEGHTVHALLQADLRSFDSILYTAWYNIRGFTAPIFMFTAGTVFVYLLFKSGQISLSSPRVKRGFRRAGYLLLIGYLLRFPTFNILGWFHITDTQWRIFSSVDALHVIAVSLVFIIFAGLLITRTKANAYLVYMIIAVFFFTATPFARQVEWIDYFPRALASYFTDKYGSIFPVFPWSGYLFSGAAFGYFLYRRGSDNKKTVVLVSLFTGLTAVAISVAFEMTKPFLNSGLQNLQYSYGIYLLRIGVVLLLISLLSVVSIRIKSLPRIVQLLGKHSLVIYAVHLMIVYGSALSPGLSWYYGKIFSLLETILIFLLITILMLLLAWLIELYKKYKSKIYNTIYVYYKRISSGVK